MYARLTGIVMMGAMTLAAAGRIEAAPSNGVSDRDHFGVVLEVDGEFGGDNIAKVYYTDGVTQDIRAGQGVTLAVGAHYQPASLPLDFTATVGYKLVRTAAYNTNLGVDRVVVMALVPLSPGRQAVAWADRAEAAKRDLGYDSASRSPVRR